MLASFIALEREVCTHAEEEQKIKKTQQPYRNTRASASTLSAQGKGKQMYEKKCPVFAGLSSPFPTELENSGLRRI